MDGLSRESERLRRSDTRYARMSVKITLLHLKLSLPPPCRVFVNGVMYPALGKYSGRGWVESLPSEEGPLQNCTDFLVKAQCVHLSIFLLQGNVGAQCRVTNRAKAVFCLPGK